MESKITSFVDAEGWERTLYAFLAEKERRSGSLRTVQGYSRMLQHFFGGLGVPPDRVTGPDVFGWAYGTGLSGKPPSQVTIGARIACLSSFYRFLIRMGAVAANPCDALERPKISPSPPKGLSADQIRRLLDVIPETPVGLRDRAIILTLTLTGRRRAEVLNLTSGDLSFEDGRCWYSYRGKGGKRGKRELPEPTFVALTLALSAYELDLAAMPPVASLWPCTGGRHEGDHERDLLRQPAPLSEGCRSTASGGSHLPALRREAPPGRRREHRGRQPLPRPLVTGCHHRVPAPARRAGGQELGEGGGGDRGVSRLLATVR